MARPPKRRSRTHLRGRYRHGLAYELLDVGMRHIQVERCALTPRFLENLGPRRVRGGKHEEQALARASVTAWKVARSCEA